jgi:hypothetical protein
VLLLVVVVVVVFVGVIYVFWGCVVIRHCKFLCTVGVKCSCGFVEFLVAGCEYVLNTQDAM